jgi:hypothetical protein
MQGLLGVELGGFEPPTSRVRCACSASKITPKRSDLQGVRHSLREGMLDGISPVIGRFLSIRALLAESAWTAFASRPRHSGADPLNTTSAQRNARRVADLRRSLCPVPAPER